MTDIRSTKVTQNPNPDFLPGIFMQRCLELAESAAGHVAPNPLVGAVLVYKNEIIGEGFHERFGEAHAEVNAVNDAISRGHNDKLNESTLFVSLEPCSHYGKTPPCTELIIRHRIPNVVVGCKDPYHEVSGRGIKILSDAGVNVKTGILENECRHINRRFITFHEKHRPHIVLKFAKTADGFMAPLTGNGKISNPSTDILVHKWRSEEQAIMVGTNTALKDNPRLTVRKWTGRNPLRIIIDKNLILPSTLNIFDLSAPTLIVNSKKNDHSANIEWVSTPFEKLAEELCGILFERNIQSVMIEGGSNLLNQFIRSGLWDEAIVITSPKTFGDGLTAPIIPGKMIIKKNVDGDEIENYKNDHFKD